MMAVQGLRVNQREVDSEVVQEAAIEEAVADSEVVQEVAIEEAQEQCIVQLARSVINHARFHLNQVEINQYYVVIVLLNNLKLDQIGVVEIWDQTDLLVIDQIVNLQIHTIVAVSYKHLR